MDMKFLQELKENKHLWDMSQETIDFAIQSCNNHSLKDIFAKHDHVFEEEILSTNESVSVEKDTSSLI